MSSPALLLIRSTFLPHILGLSAMSLPLACLPCSVVHSTYTRIRKPMVVPLSTSILGVLVPWLVKAVARWLPTMCQNITGEKMVNASVMEIYDLQTSVGKGTVLKVHTPTGNNVKRHLFGYFLQYKKFKYLGAKVSLIPASTLPADPLQLSYDAGTADIDPRDMVNPILWKHYHGETMLTDVNPLSEELSYSMEGGADISLSGSSLSNQPYNKPAEGLDYVYPSTLMDTSFRKAGVQTGFSTFVKPFIYNVVTANQLLPMSGGTVSDTTNNGFMGAQGVRAPTTIGDSYYPVREDANGNLLGGAVDMNVPGETPANAQHQWKPNTSFTTNRLVPLGWMDTLSRTNQMSSGVAAAKPMYTQGENLSQYQITGDFSIGPNLMNVPMLYVLMPPAYKTEFFFRMIIKHYFAFKGFRSCASVQSFASAGLINNLPAPPTSASTKAVAQMAVDMEGGGPETVDIENGTIIPMADGSAGDS